MWKRLFGKLSAPGTQANEDHPVHHAARQSAEDLALLLQADRLLRDQPGWFARQPLHVAAEASRLDCVDLLLSRGASPNARDGLHQWTPLHNAVSSDSDDCVSRLLEAGANVDAADARGETPIFYAKSLKVLQRLADAGADLRVLSRRGQYPFQYCAAYIRCIEVMSFWIERKVPINHVPAFGWPALNAVCGMVLTSDESNERDIEMIKLLLSHGAEINLRDATGDSSLFSACMNQRIDVAVTLLESGADPSLANVAGDTPLHAAVFRKSEGLVRLLLRHGADVNAQNRHHQTAFDNSEEGSDIRALLERLHRPQAVAVPTGVQVMRRLNAVPMFHGVMPIGCTGAEIARLEQQFSVRLPGSYREFLSRMGKGVGEFMLSDHWTFKFDDLFGLCRCDHYSEFCDLPDGYFVFAGRNGCAWAFFVADGKSEDPPVFLFDDGNDRSYRQAARSIWEFIDCLVIDYEIWSRS